MSLFHDKYLERKASKIYPADQQKITILNEWISYIKKIKSFSSQARPSEKDLHELFFKKIFVDLLEYTNDRTVESGYTLISEKKSTTDSTRADGALGFFNQEDESDVRVVIELKGITSDLDKRQNRVNDKRTPIDQAFSYAHKHKYTKWVIVSNYDELRLYHKSSSRDSHIFVFSKMSKTDIDLLYTLLHQNRLIKKDNDALSYTDKFYQEKVDDIKEVTSSLYTLYKQIRINLIENIIKNNKLENETKSIEYAQIILDRILFICFAEDNEFIPYETISSAYEESSKSSFSKNIVWHNFKGLFDAMDVGNPPMDIFGYNGGLFKGNKNIQDLKIDDDIFLSFKDMASYDFKSEVSVSILGHIFEQSISDIEEIRASFTNKDYDLKKGKRKREGVFYTPEYITSYICEKTIVKKLSEIKKSLGEDKLPEVKEGKSLSKKHQKQYKAFYESYLDKIKCLKILDPACGSGAFLIQAFEVLKREIDTIKREMESLDIVMLWTYLEKDILRNNLYGVDLNSESVEIAKLSLWLKIAKKKKKLTSLDKNILVGNSLVDDEKSTHNPFKWTQKFKEIIEGGGFDIVIGNPPYVQLQKLKDSTENKFFQLSKYQTYEAMGDIYTLFIERGFSILKKEGLLSYIVSNKWMRAGYGKSTRNYLSNKLTYLMDLSGVKVFEQATVDTCILVLKKDNLPNKKMHGVKVPYGIKINTLSHIQNIEIAYKFEIAGGKSDFALMLGKTELDLKKKIELIGTPLKDWDIEINYGIKTGYNEAFVIDKKKRKELLDLCQTNDERKRTDKIIKPMLRGRDIKRYYADWKGLYLISTLPSLNIDIEDYLPIKNHLLSFGKDRLDQSGRKGSRKRTCSKWFESQDPIPYYKHFEKEKIIYSELSQESSFTYDIKKTYISNSGYILTGNYLKYILCLLNNKFITYIFKKYYSIFIGNGYRYLSQYIEQLPIPKISISDQKPFIEMSGKMISLVEKKENIKTWFIDLLEDDVKASTKLKNFETLSLKDFFKEAKITGLDKDEWQERFYKRKEEIETLSQQIEYLDDEINQAVYKLYKLTKEEIAMIER